MKTITLCEESIYCGNLILVNAGCSLHNAAINNSLIPIDPCFPDILLQEEATNMLRFILDRISANGAIVPVSGYRKAAEQRSIYENSLKDNGEEFTRKYVALENHSEHQTGLAIDLGRKQQEIDFIRPDFPYDGICDKFRNIAPDYGFIPRYTAEKETITGISHEPWHFRYVGFPHSKIITDNGFALEEYIDFIKKYRDDHRFIYKKNRGVKIEICFVPAAGKYTSTSVQDNGIYQVSGNNVDGFILTIWRKDNDQK